jgi:hypothetical protein
MPEESKLLRASRKPAQKRRFASVFSGKSGAISHIAERYPKNILPAGQSFLRCTLTEWMLPGAVTAYSSYT